MGAREKLNVWYAVGCFVLAGLVGLVFQSGLGFVIALIVLVGINLQAGAIRPQGRRR